MNTPETLSYQLPSPLPPRLRRKTPAQRRAGVLLITGGALLLTALLALVLVLATTAGTAGSGRQPEAPAVTPAILSPALHHGRPAGGTCCRPNHTRPDRPLTPQRPEKDTP